MVAGIGVGHFWGISGRYLCKLLKCYYISKMCVFDPMRLKDATKHELSQISCFKCTDKRRCYQRKSFFL